jgi:sulfite reductase beta subunit-like hemoprotein
MWLVWGERKSYRIFLSILEGKRRIGKSRNRQKNDIKIYLKEMGREGRLE